jgi:hypothetical protein
MNLAKLIALVATPLLVMASCTPAQQSVISVDKIIAEYKNWPPLMSVPKEVSAVLFGLCRAPTRDEDAFLGSPHARLFINVRVNEAALATMKQEMKQETKPETKLVFPVGSVIVKEKLVEKVDAKPEALGIMIKRERGFNPDGGDWEYIYWKKTGESLRGPEQTKNCQSCHVAQRDTDSVFCPLNGQGNMSLHCQPYTQ